MTRDISDPFDLARFVQAQAGVYESALSELRSGAKQTHWMWFIFPQVFGLGESQMAQRYAIRSKTEALAYLAHPVLGPRLQECTAAILALRGLTATQVFGHPDDLKLRSSMTLFAEVSKPGSPFESCLSRYFSGEGDQKTLDILKRDNSR